MPRGGKATSLMFCAEAPGYNGFAVKPLAEMRFHPLESIFQRTAVAQRPFSNFSLRSTNSERMPSWLTDFGKDHPFWTK
jgi:hypothetical protein